MNKLPRNQSIGVFVSIVVVGFILFGGQFLNLFTGNNNSNQAGVTPATHAGVRVENTMVGQGVTAEKGDTVTVHYVGRLLDGQVFDSSIDRKVPFTFTLGVGKVIRGWDDGLLGMKVGGKRLLTIGPDYGYGAQVVGTIPPNSTLVFEVELLNVEKSAQ